MRVLWLVLLVASASIAAAQVAPPPMDRSSLQNYLESTVPPLLQKSRIPGASIIIVKDADVIYSGQWGFANVEKRIPVQNDRTIFRLGSVSKPFTALSVLQLAEQKKLGLNEDSGRYLKLKSGDDKFSGPVTIADLLTHTGGFEETLLHTAWHDRRQILPLGQFLQNEMPARVLPAGKFICYSNHGFVLLGYIVERASGKSFAAYLQQNIWDPLAMKRTHYGLPPDGSTDMATGYEHGEVVPPAHVQIGPAAAICAAPLDMAHFLIALLNNGRYAGNQIFQERAHEWMFRTQFRNLQGLPGMTFGFFESNYNNRRSLYHEGGIRGFSSLLYLMPEDHVAMFIVNNGYQQGFHWQICDDWLNHFFPAKPAKHFPSPGFWSRSARYSGNYRFLRYSRTTVEKLALLRRSDIAVTGRPDGTLNIGGTAFVEIGRDLFQEVGSYERAGFMTNSKDEITHLAIDQDVLEKVPWYRTSTFHQFLLFFFLIVFIVSRFGWKNDRPSGLLENAELNPPLQLQPSQVSLLKKVNILNLIFLLAIIVAMIRTKPGSIWFGLPPVYYAILSLPLLSAALTPFLIAHTFRLLRDPHWNTSIKAHFAFIALVDVLFFPYLHYWNLLGFHF